MIEWFLAISDPEYKLLFGYVEEVKVIVVNAERSHKSGTVGKWRLTFSGDIKAMSFFVDKWNFNIIKEILEEKLKIDFVKEAIFSYIFADKL